MSKRLEWKLIKKNIYIYRNRPYADEKMFIIAHLGNVKQNHNEVPFIPCIMAKTEETENPKCKLGCKKIISLRPCLWECKMKQSQ